jgi:hypothetical protein
VAVLTEERRSLFIEGIGGSGVICSNLIDIFLQYQEEITNFFALA